MHHADVREASTDFSVSSRLPVLRLFFGALLETPEIPDGPVLVAVTDLLSLLYPKPLRLSDF